MERFDCKGRVAVTLVPETLGAYAEVAITHVEDHVPYCCVSLPEDVKELVRANLSKTMSQVRIDLDSTRHFTNKSLATP